MPGWVDHAAMWTLVHVASVGLAPYTNTFSLARSYPNKVSEYLAAGLPIVSGLDGALSRLLADWRCGVTYPEGDHAALALAVRSLAEDRARLDRMKAQSVLLYRANFDPAKVYAGMVSHIEDVARGHIGSAAQRSPKSETANSGGI